MEVAGRTGGAYPPLTLTRDEAPVWALGASSNERVLHRGAGWEAIRSHLGSVERALGMTGGAVISLDLSLHRPRRKSP